MTDKTKKIKELPEEHKIRGLRLKEIKERKPDRVKQLMEIADAVKSDPSLDLQIRDGYLNVYYRGGNLLEIRGFRGNRINAYFDENYFLPGSTADWYKYLVKNQDISLWIDSISKLRTVIDRWSDFNKKEKIERENQHKYTSASTQDPSSPWIILDIEYAAWLYGQRGNRGVGRRLCRFDMIALERASLSAPGLLTVYLVEFKQGLGAVDGRAGVEDHAQDLKQFIAGNGKDGKALDAFKQSVRNILNEKIVLGLLPGVTPPPNNIEIELKAFFLFEGVELQKQNIKKLENSAKEILAGHYAEPLFRDVSALSK